MKSDLKATIENDLKELNSLYKEWFEIYHKISAKLGLSDSEFLIIYALVELKLSRQKDIADYYCISKQTINSAVKKLVKTRIIELKQAKGRDMQIIFTQSGKDFAQEKIIPIVNVEKNALIEMGQKESQELLRLTRKHLDIFKKQISQSI